MIEADYSTIPMPIVGTRSTEQIVALAVRRFVEQYHAMPAIVYLSPLRLLSIASYRWNRYPVAGGTVMVGSLATLGVNQASAAEWLNPVSITEKIGLKSPYEGGDSWLL